MKITLHKKIAAYFGYKFTPINENINQNQNRIQADDKLTVSGKHLAENIGVNQDKTIEKKEEKKE